MDALNQTILTFLVNALWQVPLAAAVAFALLRVARSAPARFRHVVLVAALAVAVALPVASARPGRAAEPAEAVEAIGATAVPAGAAGGLDVWMRGGAGGGARLPVSAPIAWGVAGVYGAFLALRLAGLWRSWRRTARIRRTAERRPVPDALAHAARSCGRAFGVGETPILASPTATGPLTVGARRPVVVLPEALFGEGDPDVLVTAIGHELAHVGRRDFAVNLACELLALPISFHPATALLRRWIGEARELACDEQVTERLLDGPSYARSLVHLARAASAGPRIGYELGVFDADILEERIMRLIDERPRASARAGRVLVMVAVLALGLSSAAASSYSVSVLGFHPVQATEPVESAMVGEWLLRVQTDGDDAKHKESTRDEGMPILLAIAWDGVKLSGTATVWPAVRQADGTVVEDPSKKIVLDLIDPKFDGTTFTFSVFNSEEMLVGELRLADGALNGRWISMKSKLSGTLSMARR